MLDKEEETGPISRHRRRRVACTRSAKVGKQTYLWFQALA